MAGSMVYRLPVGDPTAPALVDYRQAMTQAQGISDNRGYNWIAGFHGAPGWYCWHHQQNPRTNVQARLFLPWHRAYLWWLEQALQDRVAGVAQPWWDWTAANRIPAGYTTPNIEGTANSLTGSRALVPTANPPIRRRTRRQPGSNPASRLPTAADVSSLLEDTDWPSFSDRLEQLHDDVHVWVGGDMRDVTTAAYDPIFFAHHAMVDRIWYLWQVRHGNGGIPAELLDLELMPFGRRFRDVLNVQRLGYEYATSATPIPIPAPRGNPNG